jgi:hypothetical protein
MHADVSLRTYATRITTYARIYAKHTVLVTPDAVYVRTRVHETAMTNEYGTFEKHNHVSSHNFRNHYYQNSRRHMSILRFFDK